MRSAIFDKDPRNPSLRARPFVSNTKRAASSSPYIGTNLENTSKSRQGQHGRGPSKADPEPSSSASRAPSSAGTAATNLTWNFDEMVNSYSEKGSLPPLLSPTLPAQYSLKSEKTKKTPRISPDLSDSETQNAYAHTAERDREDIPLSMLSPTLPSIFDKQSALVQPIPKKPHDTTLIEMADGPPKQPFVNVRWINKLSDQKRPRFLLRLTFDSPARYREKLSSGYGQLTKLQGLGILTDGGKKVSQEVEQREKREREKKAREKEREKREKEKEKETQREREKREKDLAQKEREKKEKEAQKLKEKETQKDLEEKERLRKIEREEREKEARRKEQIKAEKSKAEEDVRKDQKKPDSAKLPRPDSKNGRLPPPPPKLPEKPSFHKEEVKNNLNNKKNYWVKVARNCQRQAEQTHDTLLSLVINLDSVLLFMISYDYDEKLKLIANILPSERYWVSTYSDITNIIDLLERFRSSPDTQSKVKNYLPFFIGLLYQSKTAILRRVNAILQKVIELYTKKSHKEDLNGKIIELQQQSMMNYTSMISDTAKGQEYLLKCPSISVKFPKTWHRRSSQIGPHEGSDTSLYPSGDKFYLPIGIYSDIREVSGLLFSSLKEFSETFLAEKDGSLRYNLQSAQKGSSSAS